MSRNMSVLFGVTAAAGVFEAVAAALPDSGDVAARAVPGFFAVILLLCAGFMWARRSGVAATVAGVLLLIDVAAVPLYERTSAADWVIQGGFALLGIVGVVAWVNVLREGSARPTAARG